MRVLLIRPVEEYTGLEPLGLMYLASYLTQHTSCEVKILDLQPQISLRNCPQDNPLERVLHDEISAFRPELIGISSMYSFHSKGLHNTARIVKQIDKDVPVVAGGAHASACTEWVLKDKNIDAAVKGEGELPLLGIVGALGQKEDISKVENVLVKRDGKVIDNSARSFIKDIDSIPLPARNLVDMKLYLSNTYSFGHSMRPPRAAIVSSRGCPYNCVYCSIHSVWQHTYRGRSPENVVDEIEQLVKEYGIGEIAFWDDNLTFNKKRIIGICDEIIRRKISIRWCTPNGVAITTLDKEAIIKMKQSGCYKLTFGIDSGCPRTQKFMRKDYIDLAQAKETIRFCNKIGLWVLVTFVIGFPFETEEDIMQTVNYAASCGANMAFFYVACPYPGSDMYDIYAKEGLIPDYASGETFEWKGSIAKPLHNTKNFTAGQLGNLRDLADKRMYLSTALSFLNPMTILPKLRGREETGYFLRMLYEYSGRLLSRLRSMP